MIQLPQTLHDKWVLVKHFNGQTHYYGTYYKAMRTDLKSPRHAKVFDSKELALAELETINANRKKLKLKAEPASRHLALNVALQFNGWATQLNWNVNYIPVADLIKENALRNLDTSIDDSITEAQKFLAQKDAKLTEIANRRQQGLTAAKEQYDKAVKYAEDDAVQRTTMFLNSFNNINNAIEYLKTNREELHKKLFTNDDIKNRILFGGKS